jgi:hypothetical protein
VVPPDCTLQIAVDYPARYLDGVGHAMVEIVGP